MSGSGCYLLDADAFICLRALESLDWLRLAASSQGPVVIMEYVALHELSTLSTEIDALKACGALRIEPVLRRQGHFRRLRQSGADKGEAEAVAWAITQNPGPVFISVDRAARRLARENKVRSGDIMDLLVDMIDLGIVVRAPVKMSSPCPGIYGSPPLYDFGVVAICELREHRSTLLLRLLGAGPTFRRALAELRRLPPEAIEVQMMLPIVVRCYRMAADAEKKTEEEEEFLMETQDVVKEWEQRLRREEREEARSAVIGGFHHALLVMYELRFGVVPDEALKARLRAISDPEVLTRWSDVIAREPQEVVDRTLTGTLS